MRLVDADALAAHFAAMQECASLRDHVYLMGVLSVIDRTPTIDAVPVVHAMWEWGQGGWCCTACGKRSLVEAVAFAKYCPRCGAKMDGGAKGCTN